MTERQTSRDDDRERDRERVTQEIVARLGTRGVDVTESDSRDDVIAISDAVERFEQQVFALGGDLMVDEPPPGQRGRPDEARFRLSLRAETGVTRHLSLGASEQLFNRTGFYAAHPTVKARDAQTRAYLGFRI